MRTNRDALQTLNTSLLVPHRNFKREIAFLILRCRSGERTVIRECANRQIITITAGNFAKHVANESRRIRRDRWQQRTSAIDLEICHVHFVQICQRVIHGFQIHLNNFITFLAVGFLDGVFNSCNRFIFWQHAREREKANLHDGVDASAHATFARDLRSIDDVELRFFREQRFLQRCRQSCPNFIF